MTTAYRIKHDRLFDPATYECSACGDPERSEYRTCPRCGLLMTGKKTKPDWIEEAAFMDIVTGGFGKQGEEYESVQ